jgi:hypothetical protein
MVEHRSGAHTAIYLGALTILVPTLAAGLLAEGSRGAWVAWVSAFGVAVVSGWYFWPWLRGLRVRSPVHTPSTKFPPVPSTVPGHALGLTEDARRRGLKRHLIFLAQRGDDLATAPEHIWRRWQGAVTDVVGDALGHQHVDTILGFAGHREQVAALRVVIRDLETLQLRPTFDPRDHNGMAI